MYEFELEIEEDKELKKVGLELMFLTPEKYPSSFGITAVELAKLVEIPTETVKKKLNILKEKEIDTVIAVMPRIIEKLSQISPFQHELAELRKHKTK